MKPPKRRYRTLSACALSLRKSLSCSPEGYFNWIFLLDSLPSAQFCEVKEKASDLFNGSVKPSAQGWGGTEAWGFVLGSPPQAFPGPLPSQWEAEHGLQDIFRRERPPRFAKSHLNTLPLSPRSDSSRT